MKYNVTLKIHKKAILENKCIKYLGVIIDSTLSWKEHLNNLSKKLSRTIGIMYKLRPFVNLQIMKNIYHALFYSHVIYGIQLWGKIKKDIEPLKNIGLHGYSPFLYQPTDTTHGGAGFYINNNLDFKERKDLNLNSTGNFETIFIELIIPNRKNVVAGCIYHHPSSIIPTTQFTTEYLDPILNIIAHENKTSVIVGDFNIDLLKYDRDNHANEFYNTMTSNFYSPFILQPTRPISKTLIDNIFLNTLEYKSTSGNITIQLSDHLFQFVILEGFFKDLPIPKLNIYQRNFKYFNEREFQETLNGINWDNILSLNASDPNLSMNNFYNQINILLDEVAPYKKLTKKEI